MTPKTLAKTKRSKNHPVVKYRRVQPNEHEADDYDIFVSMPPRVHFKVKCTITRTRQAVPVIFETELSEDD